VRPWLLLLLVVRGEGVEVTVVELEVGGEVVEREVGVEQQWLFLLTLPALDLPSPGALAASTRSRVGEMCQN